jgi:hypothetical protein
VTDQDALGGEIAECRPGFPERRRAGDGLVIDPVDVAGGGRDRLIRTHQTAERACGLDQPGGNSHGCEFDDARLAGIETGGFAVEHHGVERDKRNRVAGHHWRFPLPVIERARVCDTMDKPPHCVVT